MTKQATSGTLATPRSLSLCVQGKGGPNVVVPAPPKAPAKPEFVPGHPDKVFHPDSGTFVRSRRHARRAQANVHSRVSRLRSHPGGHRRANPQLPGAGVQLDAAQRAKAIQQYTYAKQLETTADHLTQLYNAGPGQTKGIGGYKDYLPTPQNKNFNIQANNARGIVGQTLGFTGGQLNTPREAEQAVGPYIADASNFDSTILQKIQSMRELAATQRQNAIQTLGGEPDENGVIHPVQQPVADAPPPQVQLSGGSKTRSEADPVLKALGQRVGHMLVTGAPDQQIMSFLQQQGVNPADTNINQALQFRGTKDFKQWMRANPGKAYPLGPEFYTKQIPLTGGRALFNKTAATDLGGDVAAGLAASANAISGDRLGSLSGDPMAQTGMQLLRTNHPMSSLAGDIAVRHRWRPLQGSSQAVRRSWRPVGAAGAQTSPTGLTAALATIAEETGLPVQSRAVLPISAVACSGVAFNAQAVVRLQA
jgi:hypothetical protein